jgi:outer membrane protein TolC
VLPPPDSRLFDPTPVESPILPDPAPRLHRYVIPPGIGKPAEQIERLPPPADDPNQDVQPSSDESDLDVDRGTATKTDGKEKHRFILARLRMQDQAGASNEFDITPVVTPRSAWESLPAACRSRMFEFESVRKEYEDSYGVAPSTTELDNSPRLSFDDILRLAFLNSREYQTQKEQLYRVALRLSLQEYEYQLKFAPFGNGTSVQYETRNSSLDSLSRLNIPSAAQVEALLGCGTTFITRFANEVLLTFNGPDGFAADISSELLFELNHSLFQTDSRFERLTQAERNVVYAARDFARFRRTFYLQLAVQYYNLLRTYRQVEIDAQNYLSLVRVYSQREVEFAEGEVARVQIDQVEQNALAARSSLIGTCNGLENAVDELKIRMGLPTEAPINLDLTELSSLTLADEVLVKLQLVRRVEGRLVAELDSENPDMGTALSLATELVARMREANQLQRQEQSHSITTPPGDGTLEPELLPAPGDQALEDEIRTLDLLEPWLHVAELRILADRALIRLQEARSDITAPAFRVPEMTLAYVRAVLAVLAEEREFAAALGVQSDQQSAIEQSHLSLATNLQDFETFVNQVLGEVQLQQLEELGRRADALADGAEEAVRLARATNAARARELSLNFDESAIATLSRLLELIRQLLTGAQAGLPPIDLDMDDASLAALVARLDLANARGALFDEWRGTKLAADDLKCILDLQARQRLITQNQTSRLFEVDFDEGRTELSATLDTPLNRRLQRNVFREQLLNYELSRRNVMALEDSIKQDIRANLRSIQLSREQHDLGIASAALAYERVISTELQLRLGVAGVAARDFLDAQTAYANSLSIVANRHVSYILGRITLFVDLEQLQLDPFGRWPALDVPSWNPDLDVENGPWPNYGNLPRGIHYSRELSRRSKQFWNVDSQAVDDPIQQ